MRAGVGSAVERTKVGRVAPPLPFPAALGNSGKNFFPRLAPKRKVFIINILYTIFRPNRRRGREAAGKAENRPIARWHRSISAIILIMSIGVFALSPYGTELCFGKRAASVVRVAPAPGRDPRDDLAGHVLAQEPWDVVRLAAVAEDDELHRVETVFGRQSFGREAGEPLHSERESPEMLEQIRRTLGEYNFAGQHQQAPSPQGGGMVKVPQLRGERAAQQVRPRRAELGHRQQGEQAQRFQRVHLLGDQGQGPRSPTRAAQAHGISQAEAYVREQCQVFEASVVLIEGKASGTQPDPGAAPGRPPHGHPLSGTSRLALGDEAARPFDRHLIAGSRQLSRREKPRGPLPEAHID